MIENYRREHDHSDDRKWHDAELVEWHNDLVEFLDNPDLMPRVYRQALGELACVRWEIEQRVSDIGGEIEFFD